MIVTVTLNPAYDVTYEVATLIPGQVHRVDRVRRRPGGKGVNVASVLRQLGEPVLATGLASSRFAQDVERLGIPAGFVTALPEVRSTLALLAPGATTSLWEPGPALPEPEASIELLLRRLKDAFAKASCVVVSGSLCPGLDADLPARIARLATAVGVPTLIDTSGPALAAALDVPGVVLMPNGDELRELAGPTTTPTEVARAGRMLLARGASAVLATRGRDGLIAVSPSGSWLVPAPRHVEGNPTGAGDAAAAAVARALAAGTDLVTAACDAVALAATAVAAPVAGRVDPQLYAELRPHVVAHSVPEGPA